MHICGGYSYEVKKWEQQDKYFTLVFHCTLDVGGHFVIDCYTKS